MSKLPRCCSCKHCNEFKMTCLFYPDGIPREIANQTILCNKFAQEKIVYDKSDDDLPVVKGR